MNLSGSVWCDTFYKCPRRGSWLVAEEGETGRSLQWRFKEVSEMWGYQN